jgi:hypothetical protein
MLYSTHLQQFVRLVLSHLEDNLSVKCEFKF